MSNPTIKSLAIQYNLSYEDTLWLLKNAGIPLKDGRARFDLPPQPGRSAIIRL